MITDETCNGSFWTREQDKAFENALAIYSGDSDQWEKIAAAVPGKTLDEIRHHYDLLVEDLYAIESGHVPLPFYSSSLNDSGSHVGDLGFGENGNQFQQMHVGDQYGQINVGDQYGQMHVGNQYGQMHVGQNGDQFEQISHGKRSSGSVNGRRKGIPWTEEEHRLFLLGLEKYGKGDWRSISRNMVVSRTPTQVASHAQKYFIRLKSVNKERRRSSIHDITTVDGDASAQQGPTTWQMTGGAAATGSSNETGKPPSGVPDVDMYVPPVLQSMQLPLISSVSTPYLPYGVQPTTPGFFIPTPMNVAPTTYLMPPPPGQKW